MDRFFESVAPPTSGLLDGVSYTAINYPVHVTYFAKGMLIDDNASDAVEDQDIAGGQLHRMNQRSARGGRGSGAGRGGGVGGSRSRQEYISSHQSSRFGMSGDARQASLNPPPVRTFQPTVAIYPPVDESRSRAHLTPVQGGLDRRTPRQQVPESSVRPVQRQQVPESSVRPVQRQHQLPHVVEEPVPSNTHKAIVSRTRERLTRLSVSVRYVFHILLQTKADKR
jgi:hypothetical protein